MRLIPNLLGMFVYADEAIPRHDPPALIELGGKFYINEADLDAFYRWEAHRSRPAEMRYEPPLFDWEKGRLERQRRRDAIIKLAEEVSDPMGLRRFHPR